MSYIFVPTLLLAALTSCSANNCESELSSFYAQPSSSWPTMISQKPLDEQYRIYLCGVRYMHPPPDGLAVPIAAGGAEVADFAAAKLEGSTDPVEAIAALNILVETSKKAPSICANSEVKSLVKRKGERIQREDIRQLYGKIGTGFCAAQ